MRSASSFAGIAGILAAFTISAILLILSGPPHRHRASFEPESSQHLFYAFLVALYSFIASALLFADVSGEVQEFTARASFIGMFAGLVMALAVVQLLLAIIWSGAEYTAYLSLTGARLLFGAVATLAALLVLRDQGDFFTVTNAKGTAWWITYPLLGVVGALVLVICPLGFGMLARGITWWIHRNKPLDTIHQTAYRAHNAALALSACVTTVFTAGVSVLRDATSPELLALYTTWMSVGVMMLFGICLFCFTWSLPYRRPVSGGAREQAK